MKPSYYGGHQPEFRQNKAAPMIVAFDHVEAAQATNTVAVRAHQTKRCSIASNEANLVSIG